MKTIFVTGATGNQGGAVAASYIRDWAGRVSAISARRTVWKETFVQGSTEVQGFRLAWVTRLSANKELKINNKDLFYDGKIV